MLVCTQLHNARENIMIIVFAVDQTDIEQADINWRQHFDLYVWCLQDPLPLDLLGTAHSETVKPAVLETKHLQQWRTHTERGFAFFPPEQLNEMLAHGKLQLDPADNTLMSAEAESVEPWLKPVSVIPALDLYFNDGHHSDITVSVDSQYRILVAVSENTCVASWAGSTFPHLCMKLTNADYLLTICMTSNWLLLGFSNVLCLKLVTWSTLSAAL